jgi:predicted DNA-binding ribbon-helix-helix protein
MANLRGQAVKSLVSKRSIVIAGHKTSVSLEDAFWDSLKEIASERSMTLRELVGAIDANRNHINLSSAIRLFVLGFYRDQQGEPILHIRRKRRPLMCGFGGFASTCGTALNSNIPPFPSLIRSMFCNRRSKASAKFCSPYNSRYSELGNANGNAAIAHLIRVASGIDELR